MVLRVNFVAAPRPLSRCTRIYLLDDAAVLSTATDTFFATFQSKVLGFLIGNLLASLAFGALVQAITNPSLKGTPPAVKDAAQNLMQSRQQSQILSRLTQIQPTSILSLLAALALDGIGDTSFFLPGVGEAEDVVWAPASAFLLKLLTGSNLIASVDLVKEALPFTDILPVATIAWVLQNLYPETRLAKLAGLSRTKQVKKVK